MIERKVNFSIALKPSDKKRLREYATKEKSMLNTLIEMILLNWLDRQDKKNAKKIN